MSKLTPEQSELVAQRLDQASQRLAACAAIWRGEREPDGDYLDGDNVNRIYKAQARILERDRDTTPQPTARDIELSGMHPSYWRFMGWYLGFDDD